LDDLIKQNLAKAVSLALNQQWDAAHQIAQDYNTPLACWIHAVLHKIEGDEWNSRYWYAKTSVKFEDFTSPMTELSHIKETIFK
jgi:hypothetical protein